MLGPILKFPAPPKLLQGALAFVELQVGHDDLQFAALVESTNKVSWVDQRVVLSRAHGHTSHMDRGFQLLIGQGVEYHSCLGCLGNEPPSGHV